MTNGNTSTAKYGTSTSTVTTAWNPATTLVTAQYFKNLRAASGTVTLVANWTVKTYNITYSLGGGTNNSNNPSTYTVESNNINIHAPIKTGYNFAGWQKTVSNFGWQDGYILYGTGEITTSTTYPNSHFTGFISLKQDVTYTIGNLNGYTKIYWRIYDTSGNFIDSDHGGNVYSTTITPTQDCYARILFYDTSTEEQRSGATIVGGVENNVIIPTGSAGNITLTANWTEKTAKLTYNANGHGTAPSAVTMKYTTATNAASAISETGYTFNEWNTKADGSGTSYEAGAQVKAANVVPTAMTLYAQWTAIPVTITIKKDNSNWNANSGIKVELRQSGTTKYSATASSSTVSWSPVVAGTYDLYASINASSLNTLVDTGLDVVVTSSGTATIDYYTLTLQAGVGISAVSGGGTFLKNQTANIDATVSAGYTWEGWSTISGNDPQ